MRFTNSYYVLVYKLFLVLDSARTCKNKVVNLYNLMIFINHYIQLNKRKINPLKLE